MKSKTKTGLFQRVREPQPYNQEFIHHVAGMVDTAARVVGLTPREIIDRVIDSVREPEFQNGFEERTVKIALNPSDLKALEEMADEWRRNEQDLSVSIMEAIRADLPLRNWRRWQQVVQFQVCGGCNTRWNGPGIRPRRPSEEKLSSVLNRGKPSLHRLGVSLFHYQRSPCRPHSRRLRVAATVVHRGVERYLNQK